MPSKLGGGRRDELVLQRAGEADGRDRACARGRSADTDVGQVRRRAARSRPSMRSASGSTPVNSRKASTAWKTAMPPPSSTRQPGGPGRCGRARSPGGGRRCRRPRGPARSSSARRAGGRGGRPCRWGWRAPGRSAAAQRAGTSWSMPHAVDRRSGAEAGRRARRPAPRARSPSTSRIVSRAGAQGEQRVGDGRRRRRPAPSRTTAVERRVGEPPVEGAGEAGPVGVVADGAPVRAGPRC